MSDPMPQDLARAIGHLEGEMEGLKAQLATNTEELKAISKTLSEARGGWKTLMWVGGISATMGALGGKAISYLKLPHLPPS